MQNPRKIRAIDKAKKADKMCIVKKDLEKLEKAFAVIETHCRCFFLFVDLFDSTIQKSFSFPSCDTNDTINTKTKNTMQ